MRHPSPKGVGIGKARRYSNFASFDAADFDSQKRAQTGLPYVFRQFHGRVNTAATVLQLLFDFGVKSSQPIDSYVRCPRQAFFRVRVYCSRRE